MLKLGEERVTKKTSPNDRNIRHIMYCNQQTHNSELTKEAPYTVGWFSGEGNLSGK